MAGVLTFSQFIGGPDEVKVEGIFPSTKKLLQYNFGQNITGWTFTVDHQTLVVDTITYDRYTNQPNFSTSTVIGTFPMATINSSNVTVANATTGLVNITIPGGLYSGSIIPDARKNVPLTIVGVTWNTGTETNTHRWVYIQNYEPGVTAGNPTGSTGYTALVV
jgi:hypothetical protein